MSTKSNKYGWAGLAVGLFAFAVLWHFSGHPLKPEVLAGVVIFGMACLLLAGG